MRIDEIIKERRASLLEIPSEKLTFEKRLLLSAHEPTKKKYMARYGVDDNFVKVALEPGYYWLHDEDEWEILLYDEVFNEFYRMGTQVAIGPEDLDKEALIRVAFPLCTHNWGPVGGKYGS